MKETVAFEEQYTGSASVKTLPRATSAYVDFLSDQVGARLVNDPAFIENLAAKIKVSAKIEEWLDEQEQQNSAFGPVFIADLQPDTYSADVDAEIERAAAVKSVEGGLFSEPD